MVKIKILLIYKKRLLFFLAAFLLVMILGTFAMLSPKAVTIFSHSGKLVPVYRVNTPEKKLSISFDAAWGADHTPEILKVLRDHNVKTTFFLVGFWVEDYPEMAKKIAEEGHEIGNHSSTHPNMGGLSEQQILKELKQTHDIIVKYTGYEPKLFRPPFGDYSNRLIKTARQFGYEVIQWDVDSLDWKDLSAKAIEDRVLKQVKKGSIVLFHNNGKNTAKAILPIIEKLQSKGYRIVPISELLLKGNYYIDHTGEQQPEKS